MCIKYFKLGGLEIWTPSVHYKWQCMNKLDKELTDIVFTKICQYTHFYHDCKSFAV